MLSFRGCRIHSRPKCDLQPNDSLYEEITTCKASCLLPGTGTHILPRAPQQPFVGRPQFVAQQLRPSTSYLPPSALGMVSCQSLWPAHPILFQLLNGQQQRLLHAEHILARRGRLLAHPAPKAKTQTVIALRDGHVTTGLGNRPLRAGEPQ